MRALILDGTVPSDPSAPAFLTALTGELGRRGAACSVLPLRQLHISHCLGDFNCWQKTPGVCTIEDDGRTVARAVHDADVTILFGPTSFGGYCSGVKRAVDRLVCLALPFFEERAGETHHPPRYARPVRLGALGWTAAPSADVELTFRRLVESNAVNFSSPRWSALLSGGEVPSERIAAFCEELLAPGARPFPVEDPVQAHRELLAVARGVSGDDPAPRRVALFVGSARPKWKSNSESLGRALVEPLANAGAEVAVHHAARFAHQRDIAAAAHDLLDADLLVITSPIYVDGLPFLVTRALEEMAATAGRRPALAMVVNCGFPEAAQCAGALRIGRNFADQAGMRWAGGLALGGGEMIAGRPLEKLGGMAKNARAAIAVAGRALAASQAIPDGASEALAKPLIPLGLYLAAGALGQRWAAFRSGVKQKALRARPFDPR